MYELTLRQGIYIYLSMPSHMQYKVIKGMGVEGNIITTLGDYIMNQQFFQFVKDFKLQERFLFELPIVSEWHCKEYLNAQT